MAGHGRPLGAETPREPETDPLASAILGPNEVALFENLYVGYASQARKLAVAFVGDAVVLRAGSAGADAGMRFRLGNSAAAG